MEFKVTPKHSVIKREGVSIFLKIKMSADKFMTNKISKFQI